MAADFMDRKTVLVTGGSGGIGKTFFLIYRMDIFLVTCHFAVPLYENKYNIFKFFVFYF